MRRDWLDSEANEDRWMVSYADFITLLFAFFVVMYAISSVNDEKYRVLSATLAETFSTDVASPDPIQIGEPTLTASPHVIDVPDTQGFADQDPGNTSLRTRINEMETALGGFAAQEGVSLQSDNEWIEMHLDADLFFDPGRAQLTPQARQLLEQTVQALVTNPNPITIEGYTDNVPTNGGRFPSNWELSAARASSVARYFVERGIRAIRLSAVGYGENHPLATNATPEGRASNRRVVVVVARDAQSARNRNAGLGIALIKGREAQEMDPNVVQQRTTDGGLLFTVEPGR